MLSSRNTEDKNSATEVIESVNAFSASLDMSKNAFRFFAVRTLHSLKVGNA